VRTPVGTSCQAALKTQCEYKLTDFEAPTRIRWTELSKNLVTVVKAITAAVEAS
jgi:hypothetical protein